MEHAVRQRSEIPLEYTWDMASVFLSKEAWEMAFAEVESAIRDLERFRGHLGDSPGALADWFETAEQVRDRVLEAADYIPMDRLGSTDDCGFAPFGDDMSTARETAFQKIRARVVGTEMAARQLGLT